MSPPEQMQVQVVDSLAAISPGIDDHPIALRQILLLRDLSRCRKQMAEHP